ncbi:MAG: T9SS type A sorting domain-containing protein, partial [Tannerella sp.]|nr:T9SS type A sorting domain-containing protein [Tannerella sp.]
DNFGFTSQFTGTPLKVWALGYYSSEHLDLDATSVSLGGGLYRYEIVQVVEPWTVYIGPEERSDVGNGDIESDRIWTHGNTLYINVPKEDIASIYNMTGVLYKKVEIPEGLNRFTLERGVYTVTLKDGEVHKIIVK